MTDLSQPPGGFSQPPGGFSQEPGGFPQTGSDFSRRRTGFSQTRTGLLDRQTSFAREGSSFLQDLGEAARRNPLSAALIGMGLFWMFGGVRMAQMAGTALAGTGRNTEPGGDRWDTIGSSARSAANSIGRTARANDTVDSMSSSARSMASSIGEEGGKTLESLRSSAKSAGSSIGSGLGSAADKLQDSAASAVNTVSELGRNQAGAISEYAKSIPTASADAFAAARSTLAELFEAQPLALGAIGLAVGAGIAAAMPPSELESSYLGEASAALKNKASELATEQTSRAKRFAEQVVETATEEAQKQAVEGVKSAVSDFTARFKSADGGSQGVSPNKQG